MKKDSQVSRPNTHSSFMKNHYIVGFIFGVLLTGKQIHKHRDILVQLCVRTPERSIDKENRRGKDEK